MNLPGANHSPTPLLVDTKMAAELLTIGERSLWRLTKRGDIPAIRLGRSVRYRVADLEAYIAKLAQLPADAGPVDGCGQQKPHCNTTLGLAAPAAQREN
jgi:excisionase family DNA binding protein